MALRVRWGGRLAVGASVVTALALTIGASGALAGGPPINIVLNAPLSGGSAFIGQLHFLPGARAAAWEINHHGGLLGRKVQIVLADDQDDPADGVTAIPVAVVGPSSDTALAVDPVINRAKIVDWCLCGTTQLDHMHWPYVFRPSPSDALLGAAMGMWARKEGFSRAASVFMSDTGSQTLVNPALKTFEALGGKVVINLKITPDQANYRSEAEQVLAAHPDVLIGEQDPQTAATFLTDLAELNHGKIIPMVESDAGASADFYQAVAKALGPKVASTQISALMVAGSLHTLAYAEFLRAFRAVYPHQQLEEFNTNGYDAVIISALAMAEARTTNPAVWVNNILSITNGNGPVVQTYAQGIAAIKAGKKPHYVGASGPIFFNQYHNASGNFWAIKFHTNGQYYEVQELTPKQLAPFIKFG
jgi:ABC-type branched-subunit amino acid transport system substrate-binding protein